MSLPKRIDELDTASTASVTVSAGAVVAIVTGGKTIQTTLDQFGAFGSFLQSGTGAIARTFQDKDREVISVKDFGALGDGSTNDAAAIQAAVTAAAGRPVYLPAGTYRIDSQVKYETTAQLAPGLKLFGEGQGKTIIDNRVASNSCFLSQSTSSNNFQLGGYIKGMKILTTTSPATSHGIELKATYHFEISDVHFVGMTGDQIRLTCALGDADALNEVLIRMCRFDTGVIGINSNYSSTITQPSFVTVEKCLFQGHTTAGWKHAGAAARSENNAFAAMGCPGLWIFYNTANNPQFTCIATTFENCGDATNPSLKIESLLDGEFINTEIANTVTITTAPVTGIVLSGSGTQNNVRFRSTYIRIAAAYNPFTAFTFASSSTLTRVENTHWNTYDGTGQVRYSDAGTHSVLSDTFQAYQVGSGGTSNLTLATGVNSDIALAKDGAVFDITGPGGAFSITGFANGFNGRTLILTNSSGQTGTLKNEVTSTAANRLKLDNGADVTINASGAMHFMYLNSRWQLLGHG